MFGSDPEFFIVNSDGRPIPAHKIFPPKDAPLIYEYSKIFRDGYVVELNIEPRSCRQEFAGRVVSTLREVQRLLTPYNCTLRAVPSMRIAAEDLKGAPDDVLLFGCDPSRDAYTGKDKSVELNGLTHLFRYAGGHLHYSAETTWIKDRASCDLCVRMLDLYLGVPFTFLFHDFDEFRRRKYYGQAGEYRLQKYPNGFRGIEYRVLSPRVMNHPILLSLCNGILRYVISNFMPLQKTWDSRIETKVQRAINTGFGLEDLLSTLNRFYTPELLRLASGKFIAFEFTNRDPYESWGAWVQQTTGRYLAMYKADSASFPGQTPYFWY